MQQKSRPVSVSANPNRLDLNSVFEVNPDAVSLGGVKQVGTQAKASISSLAAIFVPAGYPFSVAPEYVEFQTFDTI